MGKRADPVTFTESSRHELQHDNERYVPKHGDPTWDSEHYDLALDYSPESNRLIGKVTITARAVEDIPSFNRELVRALAA